MTRVAEHPTPSHRWSPGSAPVAVLMISYNEGRNIASVLDNLEGWAQEVFLVDSFSTDATVDLASTRGVQVVQRDFQGFGDQWNYAVGELPISAPWSMKLDPDERLTPELKQSIEAEIRRDNCDALEVSRRLWFMGRPLPVRQTLLRVWRTGQCRFSDVTVNEHPIVKGLASHAAGDLEHHDSPNLHHWYEKQNHYTTAEAEAIVRDDQLSAVPRLLGSSLERRMWLKRTYRRLPLRHTLMFIYCYLWQGAWKAGKVGFIWARLRSDVYRQIDYKAREMRIAENTYSPLSNRQPATDRAPLADDS